MPAPPDRSASTSQPAESRLCGQCGYDLFGLREGGRCPECGAPIVSPKHIDAPMSDMPIGVIRRFRTASWLASASLVLGILAALTEPIVTKPAVLNESVLVVAATAWIVAVWRLTPALPLRQARSYGFGSDGILRWIVRVLQVGLFAFAAAALAEAPLPAGTRLGWLDLVLDASLFCGTAGIIALCAMLARLSEWTRDDTAQACFTGVMWGLPVGIFLAAIRLPIVGCAGILFNLALPVIAFIIFPLALISLSRSLSYSVAHSLDAVEREHRRRARRRRFDDDVARSAGQR